jgi:hypothetical protein
MACDARRKEVREKMLNGVEALQPGQFCQLLKKAVFGLERKWRHSAQTLVADCTPCVLDRQGATKWSQSYSAVPCLGGENAADC